MSETKYLQCIHTYILHVSNHNVVVRLHHYNNLPKVDNTIIRQHGSAVYVGMVVVVCIP